MIQLKKSIRIALALIVASVCFATSYAGDKKWDEQPKIKKSVAPENPSGITGMVAAIIVITPDGTVSEASISKTTDPELEKPVLDAVQKWLFHPAKLDGKPIECKIKVPFKFKG